MSYARFLAVGVAAALAGCGDLNPPEYPGEERYDVSGTIAGLAPATTEARSYAALQWLTFSIIANERAYLHGEVSPVEFPAPFQVSVYDPPMDDEWAVQDPGAGLGAIGFGRIFVFEDVDGDGRYGGLDLTRGTTDTTLVYARELSEDLRAAIRAEGWPVTNIDAVEPGFQLATMQLDRAVTIESDSALRTRIVIDAPPTDPPPDQAPAPSVLP
jgi:hypothetical protein